MLVTPYFNNLIYKTMNYEKEQKRNALTYLKKILKPQKTVINYLVTDVANSGMSRSIRFFIVHKGEIVDISYDMAVILDEKNDHRGLRTTGCGMDMGFNAVYNLGRIMYPKGSKTIVTGRNGDTTPETDGGYLLKYRAI